VIDIPLQEEIKQQLEQIKLQKGVENIVLTQRDGNPIQANGIWLSKNEIFSVSAATSAIYNCGLQLHKNALKYILIEGQNAKILLTPLRNSDNPTLNKILEAQNLIGNDEEFFIAITTQPLVNLGGIFLKTKQILIEIKKTLILSGEPFKPPLRHYTEDELKKIYDDLNAKEDISHNEKMSSWNLGVNENIQNQLDTLLKELNNQTFDIIDSYISLDGGFVIASLSNQKNPDPFYIESNSSMTNTLFITADKCSWLLKHMHIDSILLECENHFQFINKVENGILSVSISKGRQKLGLLRLLIPRYSSKITQILNEIKREIPEKQENLSFKSLISELML